MSNIAIRVEGVGKRYRIGKKKSGDLRETFGNVLRSLIPTANSHQPGAQKDFWALNDISFEVKQGEAVGIIGRNGAGKSTLLKILSRITKPTTGRFEINGRVSSLLEVGTGFHPELTGRENIYLNGTILGMKRREIKSKFDEIVAFSGVENFIDTPVKHYSSGMKVRLAFSVAAHLEPEILIIDEVLAVGDAEFQKKCLGKMEDVTGQGRTVLFVSHNMGAVKKLCQKGILIVNGNISLDSTSSAVIEKYLQMGIEPKSEIKDYKLCNEIFIEEFCLNPNPVVSTKKLGFKLSLKSVCDLRINSIGLLIYNAMNERVSIIDLRRFDGCYLMSNGKVISLEGEISHLPLIEGFYNIGLFIGSNVISGSFTNLIKLEVGHHNMHDFIPYPKEVRGFMELRYKFSLNEHQA
jgi:lipopolysaccharide transport system ATP-binding protein